MNKEMLELLKAINEKKAEIRAAATDGRTEDARNGMKDLEDMQARFNILVELEEQAQAQAGKAAQDGTGKQAGGQQAPTKAEITRAFINRIACGVFHKPMNERDREIMDQMSEGTGEDGGFTVPEDIRTEIHELARSGDALEVLVNREPVRTLSGSRVIEVDADSTPWPVVEEGAAFTDGDTPTLKQIKYKIVKHGGILKATRELFQDTAENVLAYIKKWAAKKERATRNAAILAALDKITASKVVKLEGTDDLKTVFNVTLDPGVSVGAVVLTNQDGFNWLDTLKDGDGRYIMQPDVTDKTLRRLFGAYPVKVVSNKTMKSGGEPETNVKYPFYIGNLKEAVTLFDREQMSIETSDVAGELWEKDLVGVKVRDRFDVQAVDEAAVVKAEVTISIAG